MLHLVHGSLEVCKSLESIDIMTIVTPYQSSSTGGYVVAILLIRAPKSACDHSAWSKNIRVQL